MVFEVLLTVAVFSFLLGVGAGVFLMRTPMAATTPVVRKAFLHEHSYGVMRADGIWRCTLCDGPAPKHKQPSMRGK